MSDKLKVAKECGAFVKYQLTSALGKVPAEVIFNVSELDDYTSRILASQQAAHEGEIAKLKEEVEKERKKLEPLRAQADYDQSVIRGLVDDSCVLSKQVISLRHALAYVLGSKDDEKIGWRSSTATDKDVFRCEFCAKQHEDCTLIEHQEDCPVTVARLALANTQAAAEQFIAECEQRGAVKALEDAACWFEKNYSSGDVPAKYIRKLIGATSKKAG